MVKVSWLIFENTKEQGACEKKARLRCSHLSRMYQKRFQHATGDLAMAVASFSDQLPVISLGCGVISLNGFYWSPFTGHRSLALTVAGQRRTRTGLPRLHIV